MYFRNAVAALSVAGMVAARPHPIPFTFPLDNGFPSPKPDAIAKIEKHAGGGIPVGPLPTKISKTAETAFQLIGVNEIFEVAFFTSLLKNITNGVPGFEVDDKEYVQRVIRRIRAQEELHALGANGILESVGAKTVGACKFEFGTTNYLDAIALANTFTDVVLSVVPPLQAIFAAEGGQEPGLIPLTSAILGQEAEQNGWFRAEQGKAPSAAPFLTGNGQAQFAASALALFIVPDSCEYLPDVPVYPPLTVVTPPTAAKNQMVTYEIDGGMVGADTHSIALINGVNAPYVEKISNIKKMGKKTQFEAKLPFESNGGFAKGLTFAILVKGTGKLADGGAVAEAMQNGPGLLEIQ